MKRKLSPTLNLDNFFYFFGECCLKKNHDAPRPSKHAPVRGCQNKRLGGTIGYYYDKGGSITCRK